MRGTIDEEIALELSRLQRAVLERSRRRAAEQQLGEAWVDLPHADVEVRASEIVPSSSSPLR